MGSCKLDELLQPLADALAAAFAEGETSAACAQVLRRLLGPDLRFLGVVVRHSSTQLVAAANCAIPGPTALHLLDVGASGAGLALARRQALQLQLQIGSTSAGVAALGDMQMLLGAAPDAQQALCVPFGCSPAAAVDGAAQPHCQQCATQGSGSGALLLGLAGAPDARRLVLLTRLAQCLPQPLAQRSADTLRFVSVASGGTGGGACPCCCYDTGSHGDDVAVASPCLLDGPEDSDRDSRGPSLLHLSAERKRADSTSSGGGAGPSRPLEPAPLISPPLSPVSSSSSSSSARSGPISKSLLAAAAAAADGGGGEALAQRSWTLCFCSALAEREYCRWMTPTLLMTDSIAAVLILVAMAIVAFGQSFHLVQKAPSTLLTSAGMALPLLFVLYARAAGMRAYHTWRNTFLTAFRVYAVVFAAAAIPVYETLLPVERRGRLDALWRLSGAEALFATAIGFAVSQKLHLPLQLATLALVLAQLPRTCTQACAAAVAGAGSPVAAAACMWQGGAMALLLGCLLPTVLLRVVEQCSRRAFTRLVLAEARNE